jgi:hypothetical protein
MILSLSVSLVRVFSGVADAARGWEDAPSHLGSSWSGAASPLPDRGRQRRKTHLAETRIVRSLR